MTDLLPKEIARLYYGEFCLAVGQYAEDRDALVEIKSAIETEMTFLADKPHIRGYYVRKSLYLDGLLRKLKPAKRNSLQNTSTQAALIVTVETMDSEGTVIVTQYATMKNVTEFMSGIWRATDLDQFELPHVRSYWQCHDLASIPTRLWDDTYPLNTEPPAEHTKCLHEAFSC